MMMCRLRIQKLKIGPLGGFQKIDFFSFFLMRKRLSSAIIICQFQKKSTVIHFFVSVHVPATSEDVRSCFSLDVRSGCWCEALAAKSHQQAISGLCLVLFIFIHSYKANRAFQSISDSLDALHRIIALLPIKKKNNKQIA